MVKPPTQDTGGLAAQLAHADQLGLHFAVVIDENGWEVSVGVVVDALVRDNFHELSCLELGGESRQIHNNSIGASAPAGLYG